MSPIHLVVRDSYLGPIVEARGTGRMSHAEQERYERYALERVAYDVDGTLTFNPERESIKLSGGMRSRVRITIGASY
jgi:ATPase subunit of ABC transporter with duplicated ATPase domains